MQPCHHHAATSPMRPMDELPPELLLSILRQLHAPALRAVRVASRMLHERAMIVVAGKTAEVTRLLLVRSDESKDVACKLRALKQAVELGLHWRGPYVRETRLARLHYAQVLCDAAQYEEAEHQLIKMMNASCRAAQATGGLDEQAHEHMTIATNAMAIALRNQGKEEMAQVWFGGYRHSLELLEDCRFQRRMHTPQRAH